MKKITLFSSGNLSEEKSGSYRVLLSYQERTKEWVETLDETTQNRLELSGLIKGLSMLQEPCDVTLYTDAPYLEKGLSLWLEKWEARDFSSVYNRDLWEVLARYIHTHSVTLVLLDQEVFERDYSALKQGLKTT